MGTITCTQIITRCQNVLQDTAATRWAVPEMLDWINDGLREIATAQPEATAKVANVSLVAGTKQSLPAGAIALIRVIRNMGVGGTTPAEAPRQCSMILMDQHLPTWHAAASTLLVKNWMKDTRIPRTFYVYPPMTSATIVECEYSAAPTPVTAGADVIPVDDFYAGPLTDYVLWRAFSKDLEVPGLAVLAGEHRAAFEKTLGLTAQGEAAEK